VIKNKKGIYLILSYTYNIALSPFFSIKKRTFKEVPAGFLSPLSH
jgi:hypothetical protein